MNCPVCNADFYSQFDLKYIEVYGYCWGCDDDAWIEKLLTTEEFETREETIFNLV